MIDAFLSLRSAKAQEIVLQNVLRPNSSASDADRLGDFQRVLLHFGGFEAPPITVRSDEDPLSCCRPFPGSISFNRVISLCVKGGRGFR